MSSNYKNPAIFEMVAWVIRAIVGLLGLLMVLGLLGYEG